jgi:hypothetical protein
MDLKSQSFLDTLRVQTRIREKFSQLEFQHFLVGHVEMWLSFQQDSEQKLILHHSGQLEVSRGSSTGWTRWEQYILVSHDSLFQNFWL